MTLPPDLPPDEAALVRAYLVLLADARHDPGRRAELTAAALADAVLGEPARAFLAAAVHPRPRRP